MNFFSQLEDFEYKSLDPKDIRLPPPMPPSERLLAAVEAFYQQPSRERPRDGLVFNQSVTEIHVLNILASGRIFFYV